MKRLLIEPAAFEDLQFWAQNDHKLLKKILALISNIHHTPFAGKGKPEPLKHQLKGYWSRRINEEHRLVYQITDDFIIIASARLHYKDQ
jgi:toxin YoeB